MRGTLLSRAEVLRAAAGALVGGLAAALLGRAPAFAEDGTNSIGSGEAAETVIVRCVIHPGIGIARVGNSTSDFFIGPEVPGVSPAPLTGFKDGQGRIKRQTARFRLYGLNAAGQVVKELTADDASITWSVHLANKKAAWYQFKIALDIPEAASPALPPTLQAARRNAAVKGRHRRGLVIDPGARSITGKLTRGPARHFDSGTFRGRRVPLGELRTDADGHLLVLGGFGTSGTTETNNPPAHIANNDGWYDDTSDGPVTATVRIRGKKIPVTPAWVIVAPPDYAPGMTSVVTLYDIAYQAYLDAHPKATRPVSFTRDIAPILARFDRLQWVNEGFFRGYGSRGEVPLLDPTLFGQLASNSPANALTRKQIFGRFRNPSYAAMQEDAWPRVYGDNFAQPPASPRQYLAVTHEQYRCLSRWSAGKFIADWNPAAPVPQTPEDLSLQDRPAALDRAALESCSGGAFHPGEEAPWAMRRSTMYMGLFRLRPRGPGDRSEPNYGPVLTPQRALGLDGPLRRSGPGDITRWMAVPWQTDTANCGSAYPSSTVQPPPLPDLPTFWPAVVPNKILTEQAYRRIMNTGLAAAERQMAFVQRVPWARHLSPNYLDRNNQAITAWSQLGVITPQPGPADPSFPSEMYVETESGFPATGVATEIGKPSVDDRQALL